MAAMNTPFAALGDTSKTASYAPTPSPVVPMEKSAFALLGEDASDMEKSAFLDSAWNSVRDNVVNPAWNAGADTLRGLGQTAKGIGGTLYGTASAGPRALIGGIGGAMDRMDRDGWTLGNAAGGAVDGAWNAGGEVLGEVGRGLGNIGQGLWNTQANSLEGAGRMIAAPAMAGYHGATAGVQGGYNAFADDIAARAREGMVPADQVQPAAQPGAQPANTDYFNQLMNNQGTPGPWAPAGQQAASAPRGAQPTQLAAPAPAPGATPAQPAAPAGATAPTASQARGVGQGPQLGGAPRPAQPTNWNARFQQQHGTQFDPNSRMDRGKMQLMNPGFGKSAFAQLEAPMEKEAFGKLVQQGLNSAGGALRRSGAKARINTPQSVKPQNTPDVIRLGGKGGPTGPASSNRSIIPHPTANNAPAAMPGDWRMALGNKLKGISKGLDTKKVDIAGGAAAGAGALYGSNRMGHSSGREQGVGEGYDVGTSLGLQAALSRMPQDPGILGRIMEVFKGNAAGPNGDELAGLLEDNRDNALQTILSGK